MYTTIAISILVGLICFFIGKNFRTKNDLNWKLKFDEVQKELNSKNKKQKKLLKNIQQLEQNQISTQQKITETEEKYIPLNNDLTQQLQTAQAEIQTQKTTIQKLNSDYTYLNHQYEAIKKERSRLNDKYATDMKASKGWANKKESLERDLEHAKARFLAAKKETKEIQNKLEAQQERMEEVRKFTQEFRNMKSTNRKLTKDLAYWEQKHFDTHHELAATTKEIDALKAANEDMTLRFKGAVIQQQNMLKKIEEFKTKFVNVNNLYHELKKERNLN